MSLAALAAGHHVMCEKPLALNLAEARELREAVKQYDRRFMVGEQYRFAGGVEDLRRAVAAGRIGPLAYIAHEFYRGAQVSYASQPERDEWMRAYLEPSLQEMSVHHFDMWYYITGLRCSEICVKAFDAPWNASSRKLGHSAYATLEDGTHVDYLTCRALARPQTTWFGNICVVGQEGTLTWDGSGPVLLSRVVSSADPQNPKLATEAVSYVDRGGEGTALTMIRALVEAIREGTPHPCSVEDNFVSFATSIAAAESAQTGRPVKVVAE
jgi:predicted dehydrogenase